VPVDAYEYEYRSSDSDGNTTWHDALVVAVHHDWIQGDASFYPDPKVWSAAGALIDALMWVPPFTFVKAFQLMSEARNPDRSVGHAGFDRAYVVHAASDEAAHRAVGPALRDAALAIGLRATVELRTGTLLYSPNLYGLDAQTAVSALGIAAALLGALGRRSGHPMR
jgi:hypothetical protein